MIFEHNFVPDLKLKQITDENGMRVYMTPNGSYESVTSYLKRTFEKPWLKVWVKKVGEKKANTIRNAASKRGKSLHSAAEDYLMNRTIDLSDSPNTKILFLKIKGLLERCNNIRLIEKPLYSDELQLAGTPDIIAEFDKELAVIDVKSNTFANKKRIDLIDYMIQTACYSVMFNERYGMMPKKSIVFIASPNDPNGILRTEDMSMCVSMLRNFRKDPVKFAADIAKSRENKHEGKI